MTATTPVHAPIVGPRYKWVVLSNTTVGVLLATTNATSLMIALPVIFRGIHLNPLVASNFPYLLWILMGYMLVLAAVVVTVGRIGDIFGRVRMYNLGFAWFTLGAILLSAVWSQGSEGALELIILRMFQAIGGALLMANSAAIITDAFPAEQLGLALGTNMVAAILGSFLGILVGGLLAQVGWRWVFLANVPIGVFGTIWAYLKLKEIGIRIPARIDWLGNIAFASGLAMLLTGFTYAIKPYGNSLTGWGNPFVLEMIFGGLAMLAVFLFIETKVEAPLFRLSLFRIRAFSAGNAAGFLGSIGRGGFQFMLMIWLQGIWLPEHGYDFTVTPLWSGIYMIPFMLGFVVAGPTSGRLSDRFGARPFATAGMLVSGAMFGLRSLSAVVGLHPIWASAADHASFLAIVSTIGANSWVLGIAILVGLLCIWVASTSTGRHDLAALCFVALVLSGTLVLTFSSIPRAQLLYISYLDPASWPVGMIVTLAGLWALAELSVWAARRVAARHRSRRQGLVPSIRALRWFVLGLTAVMGALTVASDTVIAGHSLDDTQVRAEGWPMIPQVASVSARIERVVPRGGVMIVTHSLYGPGVVTGVLWELYSDGWRPKAGHYYGRLIGPEVLASGTAPPVTATVTYTGFSPATVAVSGTRRS